MQLSSEQLDIATADYSELAPTVAADYMIATLLNRTMVGVRAGMLQELARFVDYRPAEDFSKVIERLKTHDLVELIYDDIEDLSRWMTLFRDPTALRLAHQAVTAFASSVENEQAVDSAEVQPASPIDLAVRIQTAEELRTVTPLKAFNMDKIGISCGPALAGHGGATEERTQVLGVCYDHPTGNVLLEIPAAKIPNGLLRVWFIDKKTDRAFSWLPELVLDDDHWYGKSQLNSICEDHTGQPAVELYALEAATLGNRLLFDTDQVRTFVDELDSAKHRDQVQKARDYLGMS